MQKLGADSKIHVFVSTRNRKLADTPNQALAEETTVGFLGSLRRTHISKGWSAGSGNIQKRPERLTNFSFAKPFF